MSKEIDNMILKIDKMKNKFIEKNEYGLAQICASLICGMSYIRGNNKDKFNKILKKLEDLL